MPGKRQILFTVMIAAALLVFGSVASAEVEWEVLRQVKFSSAPLDVSVSADGQKIFVLLADGEVQILDTNGRLQETLQFGVGGDRIAVSPAGDRLFLSSREGRQLQVASLDFVKKIDITGSPFKGPEDAKVVVAVYSDFQ